MRRGRSPSTRLILSDSKSIGISMQYRWRTKPGILLWRRTTALPPLFLSGGRNGRCTSRFCCRRWPRYGAHTVWRNGSQIHRCWLPLATLLTPGFLVSANSVMCDTMALALWLWAIIFWVEGLEPQKPQLSGRFCCSDYFMRIDQVLWHSFDSTAGGVLVGPAAASRKLGLVSAAANSGPDWVPAVDESGLRTAHDHVRRSYRHRRSTRKARFDPGQCFG